MICSFLVCQHSSKCPRVNRGTRVTPRLPPIPLLFHSTGRVATLLWRNARMYPLLYHCNHPNTVGEIWSFYHSTIHRDLPFGSKFPTWAAGMFSMIFDRFSAYAIPELGYLILLVLNSHFADDILKCIFLNDNVMMPIKISLKFVPKGQINNISALVQIMDWRRTGGRPLSELTMVILLTHVYASLGLNVSY